jgi:hypothetical protein
MLYVPGIGKRHPFSCGEATLPGRHASITLKGPSQLGRVCGALLGSVLAVGLGPGPRAPYYARSAGDGARALGCIVHFRSPLAICVR